MDMVTIIGLVVILIFGLGAWIVSSKNKKRERERDNKKNGPEKIDDKSVKRKNDSDIPRKDVFEFMEFDKIVDNMIIQENGNKYTMVVQCKGINYDLMSDVEQLSVEEGFITFLNTLKFPIQLYVQATAIDLKKSMNIYKNSVDSLENKFNQSDEEYKKLSKDLSSEYDELMEAKKSRAKYANILEYAEDITNYVERLSLNKYMLQRKFYVILSYYKSEVNATTEFTSKEIHDICFRELYTRAQSIISGLMACSVTGKVLDSNEVAELLYVSYNRDDEKLLDVKTALDSGFYRLYSTSKDVFEKKEELMEKEIQEEAAKRVKDTIQEAMQEGILKTQEQLIEEYEERADREAIKIINTSELPSDAKTALNNMVAEKHVVEAEKRKQIKNGKRSTKVQEENKDIENSKNKDGESAKLESKMETKSNLNEKKKVEEKIVKEPKIVVENEAKVVEKEVPKYENVIEPTITQEPEKVSQWSGGLRDKPSTVEEQINNSNTNGRTIINDNEIEQKVKNDSNIDESEKNTSKKDLNNDNSDEDELII